MTTIAQSLEETWCSIIQIKDPAERSNRISDFKKIVRENARAVTADLFSTARHHLAFQDGSILTRNRSARNPINAYVRGGGKR